MLRRPRQVLSGPQICQACELISGRQWIRQTGRPSLGSRPARHTSETNRAALALSAASRCFATSRPNFRPRKPQQQPEQNEDPGSESGRPRFGRPEAATAANHHPGVDAATAAASVGRVLRTFLGPEGIPSEAATLAALRGISEIDVRPAVKDAKEKASSATDGEAAAELLGQQNQAAQRAQDAVDKVSDAAYKIITQPTVVITPAVLAEYVRIQGRLLRPKSLPQILKLYATKPTPKMVSGAIQYVEPNPNRAAAAVDLTVADEALDAAIAAKDFAAAVGIVQSAYATKAYVRAQLLRRALLPTALVTGIPVVLYIGATQLAQLQYSMEPKVATGVAFVGVLCYVGFTATIGMVAHTTANDHVKRLSWAIGTPLHHRWLYEDERAAMDKVACSFGFSDEARYGEEEGPEFQWLREYALTRYMILDAVSLMPGMN
ncbi:uncharacterized protein C8A04DRAFT_37581 [Dichotomopilus funicola]|uniref:Uncharacterized protein n=1 Tax=Dichotomopilus funicola TaxID=1934379 RepID=A0AAN6V1W3_9PEZI|nr:hypothetical protein C8A04DRAFT_37581 [Dichotomopilus funicola]